MERELVIRMPPGASPQEARLMADLLSWQGLSYTSHPSLGGLDIWVLGKTRGKPIAVVLDGGGIDAKALAVGFFGLVDYLNREGLVRC